MGQQKVSDLKSSLDVAFDIEIVVQIGFGQANLCAGQKHSTQRFAMFQREHCGTRPLIGPCRTVREPHANLL